MKRMKVVSFSFLNNARYSNNILKKCNYMCKHSKFYSFIVGLQRRPEFHKRGEYRFFLVD